MTRRELRINRIKRRIKSLENDISFFTQAQRKVLTGAAQRKLDRLLDRRDKWEERLVLAELD